MIQLRKNKKIRTSIIAGVMALCMLAPGAALNADASVSSGWQHAAVNTVFRVNLYEADSTGNATWLGKMSLNEDGREAETNFYPAVKSTFTVYAGTSPYNYKSKKHVATTTTYGIKMACTSTGYGKVNATKAN